MINWVHSLISRLRGKNSDRTPVAVIRDQLLEKRALPMGVTDFHEWSDRIIGGACIPGATPQSQKFSLAHMVHQTDDDFECDAFFIKKLRKTAINQVCAQVMEDIRNEVKARLAKEEAEAKAIAESGKPKLVETPTK